MDRKYYRTARQTRAVQLLYDGFCKVAPLFRPAISTLGARRSGRILSKVERCVKGALFDCQMCGECVLSSTGMVCPMNCGKQLRNGPCGGVADDCRCEVHPELYCVWLSAYEGAVQTADPTAINRIQPPLDHTRQGTATWLKIIAGEPVTPPSPKVRNVSGDLYAPGGFELACRSGNFVVTAEISPPDSVDSRDLLRRAEVLRGLVQALNVTDNAGANCHMSSAAASSILSANGHTPVFQSACRDRNRIAVQADIMGIAALGVRNMLCLTGDGVGAGDQPQAKPVFDLDSVSLLNIARGMRDQGTYASGRSLMSRPNLFLGASANPFVPSFEERVLNLEKKIAAGAQFIQTQYCFDVELLVKFMNVVRSRGLDRQCHILVGVGPLSSARTARWLAEKVPGVHIPLPVIKRLEQAHDHKLEGISICIETILAVQEIKGITGVHLMGHKNEHILADIIRETGLGACRT